MKSAPFQAASTSPFSTRNDLKMLSSPQITCFRRERILDGENRGQRFDFDADRAAGFFQEIFVRMREEYDGLFGMIHEFVREAGLIVDDQRDAVFAGNVFCGDDGEFGPGNAGTEMHAADAAARGLWCGRSCRSSMPGKEMSST